MELKRAFIVICVLLCLPVFVQSSPIYTEFNNIAASGYDVTTFFTEEGPQMGSSLHSVHYKGAYWYFVNQGNLEKFKRNPEKYEPTYGGYCVWAISHGRMTGGFPQYWHILDGKLYLLCSQDALEKWLKDPYTHNRRADERWPSLIQ